MSWSVMDGNSPGMKGRVEVDLSNSCSQGAAPWSVLWGTPARVVCHKDQKSHSTCPQSLPVSPISLVYCNQY
jgi:hypothetical protein